jgi:hypothetical protein
VKLVADFLAEDYQVMCEEISQGTGISPTSVFPSQWCLHFEEVGGLEWSKDPESYAGGSYATGRVSLAGQVNGVDPD